MLLSVVDAFSLKWRCWLLMTSKCLTRIKIFKFFPKEQSNELFVRYNKQQVMWSSMNALFRPVSITIKIANLMRMNFHTKKRDHKIYVLCSSQFELVHAYFVGIFVFIILEWNHLNIYAFVAENKNETLSHHDLCVVRQNSIVSFFLLVARFLF